MHDSYQFIKNFVNEKLTKVEGALPESKIHDEITDMKKLMSQLGSDIFARILSVPSIEPLEDDEWTRMTRELETHFDVEMSNGILIQGTDQQRRDSTWWTNREKLNNELYYWNRYRELLRKQLPPDVLYSMDQDTDVVMDNVEDPSVEHFTRYGMVVGHVQSGKTGNYSALICKAADAGYKFIVIIAGGINNLRNQTQERINEAFVGIDKGTLVGVGRLGGFIKGNLPISLTTTEQDFNRQDANRSAQGLNFDNIKAPMVLVIKKNTNTLKNVISWLESQYKNQISNHAMLMIDDESDYASINTKNEDDPTTINKNLRKLISLFKKGAYVAFTATPYANIFIDHLAETDELGKDLFPDDFIYALQPPTNYFGAQKIFLDSNGKYLVPIDDYKEILPLNHKITTSIFELPESLWDAVRLFVINVAIRRLRGQGNKHNSMLVHVTRFTSLHIQVSALIEEYFTRLKKDVISYGKLDVAERNSKRIMKLKQTFESKHKDIEFSWTEVLDSTCEIIKTIIIRQVHSETKIPLEYRKDSPTNAIVVGGSSLSRGFTLEGLSVSYFLRNTMFYDTLMQMGRWFGYRTDYEDICRVYMSDDMVLKFKLIIEATEDLFDDFKRMSDARMTPKDFGLAVKHHPDSGLQVTARNKLRNTEDLYFEMKLDGRLKETSWIIEDNAVNKSNIETINKTVLAAASVGTETDQVNKNLVWKNVNKSVVLEFLRDFKVAYSGDEFGISTRMPINFVIKYAQEIETTWDIALYSGDSSMQHCIGDAIHINLQERKVKSKGEVYEVLNRQVSSGNAEAVAFAKQQRKELGSSRKDAREKMERPLLMLHLLDAENETGSHLKLAAFGVSFPGGIKSTDRTVKLKINSVFIQNLLEQENHND